MARVVLAPALRDLCGGRGDLELDGADAGALLAALDERFPGVAGYVRDEHGALRPHVNLFVDGQPVADRAGLSDAVAPGATVHLLQALSGG